jgi:hypothetical protein
MRRVVRWDGIVCQATAPDGSGRSATPDDVRAIAKWVARERPRELRGLPFEIVIDGTTPADDAARAAAKVARFEAAGATWWIDADWDGATVESVRHRIQAGPPRG